MKRSPDALCGGRAQAAFMTAILSPAPATPLGFSRRSPAMLVVGLVACVSGFAMLAAGAAPLMLTPRPGAVSAATANQPSTAPTSVRHDAVRNIDAPRRLPPSNHPTSAARRPGPITTHDRRNAELIALVRPGLDIRGGLLRPSPCREADLGPGTRAESAEPSTLPLQRHPREALLALSAAQHGGPGVWSGSCLLRRLSRLDPIRADSDDRIANALVAAAPTAPSQRLTGPR